MDNFEIITKRKKYGQFFTPPTIAALASAAAIHKTNISIIDPMCGNGNMLWAAYHRLLYLGDKKNSRIVGVDIDPLLIKKIQNTQYNNIKIPEAICADAFIELSKLLNPKYLEDNHKYDVIIGNPPYIRYQNLAPLLQETSPELMNAFKNEMHSKSDSLVASTVIRTCLISNLIPNFQGDYQKIAHYVTSLTRTKSYNLNEVDELWLKIVLNYSGLADLSLPAWLLTWRISKPNSIISFVTSASWKNREYARILRYFMMRFLQPLFIIEQEGNSWFGDAQIPTSLMVFRVRTPDDIVVPLAKRIDDNHKVKIVRIKRDFDLSNPSILKKIALSINPNCVPKPLEEEATYADVIIKGIIEQNQNKKYDFGTLNVVQEQSLINDLLHEDIVAQQSGATGKGLQALENNNGHNHNYYTSKVSTPQFEIPSAILQALGIKVVPDDTFYLLNDLGVSVNQGLRTGCNPFFYVQRLSKTDWKHLLPCYDPEIVLSILDSPSSRPNDFLRIIDSFKKVGAIIPSESPFVCPSSTVVKLSSDFNNKLAIFPKSYLKPALRYQNRLTHWSIIDSNSLYDYVIVIGSGATQADYLKLQQYPKYWIDVWKKRDHLSVLTSSLSEYISLGSITILERNGRRVLIPDLSAVAPNVRKLSRSQNNQLNIDESLVPRIPSWWYTISIQVRHYGLIFIPRVNDDSIYAYLNDPNNPTLVDANFSTITIKNEKIPLTALYAIFNSIWINAILEEIATPMGGGSLKVEASHLRLLPIPNLDNDTIKKLKELGLELAKLPKSDNKPCILNEIDKIITNWIAKKLNIEQSMVLKSLEEFTNELRLRRKR